MPTLSREERLLDAGEKVANVLQYNHPTAVINYNEGSVCDIQVQTLQDSILIRAFDPYTITDQDIYDSMNSSLDIGDGLGEEFSIVATTETRTDFTYE